MHFFVILQNNFTLNDIDMFWHCTKSLYPEWQWYVLTSDIATLQLISQSPALVVLERSENDNNILKQNGDNILNEKYWVSNTLYIIVFFQQLNR